MFASLLRSRRFAPLFWCQFFSAFNDNFLKNGLSILILFGIGAADLEQSKQLVALAGALFIAPFFFLSGLGGELADRFDKALIARRLKFAEIGAAALAGAGFAFQSLPVLFAALISFGVISALFGPIKYGILPDHLRKEDLPAGNALVEGATFVAILAGTIAGNSLAEDHAHAFFIAAGIVAVAVACWLSARMIPATGEAAPTLSIDPNILRSTWRTIGEVRDGGRLWWGTIAVSWFWMLGVVLLLLVQFMVKEVIGGGASVTTVVTLAFTVGIALGSLAAAWLSGGRQVLFLTIIGGVLLSLFSLLLALKAGATAPAAQEIGWRAFLANGDLRGFAYLVSAIAFSGGLFIVPVFAAVQSWAGEDRRARVIAAGNAVQAALMVLGALGVELLQRAGFSIASLLIIVSGATALATIAFLKLLPMNPWRDAAALVLRLFYRVEVRGAENLKGNGRHRVIVANHVSFLDGALMATLTDGDPLFAIDHAMMRQWWVKPFARVARMIAIDPANPFGARQLINAVKSGETLVIFPEGRITVTGSLMKIYDGAGLVADKGEAEILPVFIDGAERTPFSRLGRDQVARAWFPKIVIHVLPPRVLTVAPSLVGRARRRAAGAALTDVMMSVRMAVADLDRTLFQALVARARHDGFSKRIIQDPLTGALSYRKLLIGSHALGAKLAAMTQPGERVGVLLPNSNAVVVTFFALQRFGRTPAMLNFSAGPTNIASACVTANIKLVLTSRAFIERGKLESVIASASDKARIVFLEDVRETIGATDKIRAFIAAKRESIARNPDDEAAILFTSGSEGAPKGVVLSHKNILANCAQVRSTIDFGPSDLLFNVLPVFHSFGLTVGMMLPILEGVPLFLYPTPLHYRLIPELIYGVNATILFGTDTFLRGYARMAHPYDFRSLRIVGAGAEPVQAETRRTYLEKFGARILEGYGVTEASPVVALNTPMFAKAGSVGRLMPEMEARLEPMPGISEGGRLYLHGPNIMKGYLLPQDPGALHPPPGGWHDTGDIVTIDSEGFVTIRGRAKRFAKIGGEMISLAAVEAALADYEPPQLHAIIAAPDERKGERLVMVTAAPKATLADAVAHLKTKGLTALSMPSEMMTINAMPVLGSGKIDFVSVDSLVRARSETSQPAQAAPQLAPGAA
ncbi:MAG: acyl-[ACP]--phospholipid O-acyltransferase [Rhizobiales bacterium 65-9]|nr:acyl-[ACP]--phospholipid O-acyltransferase [Hyphomicrobiales bacterium]OJY33138.1 MAG: acyl-[ACP]--phospholipid O-acyltransferase [Rhizobiales bacterium 65-9]